MYRRFFLSKRLPQLSQCGIVRASLMCKTFPWFRIRSASEVVSIDRLGSQCQLNHFEELRLRSSKASCCILEKRTLRPCYLYGLSTSKSSLLVVIEGSFSDRFLHRFACYTSPFESRSIWPDFSIYFSPIFWHPHGRWCLISKGAGSYQFWTSHTGMGMIKRY